MRRARGLAWSGAGFAAVAASYVLVIRRCHQKWGATVDEIAAAMPGDDRIANPNWKTTRAVSIGAPPASVWPWLVQMGTGRGGLYSYDRLDRLFGVLDRPSATSVLPEFQHLSVGDVIPIANDPGWPVAVLERERSLVLDIERPRLHITWSFLLIPFPAGGTRLILRYRGRLEPRIRDLPFFAFLDIAEFIMTRKMLLGIRQRAERLAGHRA